MAGGVAIIGLFFAWAARVGAAAFFPPYLRVLPCCFSLCGVTSCHKYPIFRGRFEGPRGRVAWVGEPGIHLPPLPPAFPPLF